MTKVLNYIFFGYGSNEDPFIFVALMELASPLQISGISLESRSTLMILCFVRIRT
jgi:hypothetical protein